MCTHGRLSLSIDGAKCAVDNFIEGGGIYYRFNINFNTINIANFMMDVKGGILFIPKISHTVIVVK